MNNNKLFKDGDKVIINDSTLVHVLINSIPDDEGFVVVSEAHQRSKQYRLVMLSRLTPHIETIHVQLREPKVGETFLAYNCDGPVRGGEFVMSDIGVSGERYVIVGRS